VDRLAPAKSSRAGDGPLSLGRSVLWLLLSTAILLLGLGLLVAAMYGIVLVRGGLEEGQLGVQQAAALLYFRVVLLKGLLPQLALTLALWPALSKLLPFARRSRAGLSAGLAIAAALAWAIVAPLVLSTSWPFGPPLRMRGLSDKLGTALLMTAAVATAAALPRLRALRPPSQCRVPKC